MGFVAGLGVPTGMGVPTYYVDGGGNAWDANTYATIVFDNSGSMGQVITAMTNAAIGPYFSSGSAAGGDGVKNVDSLRSQLQDLYASGDIEGAPAYNTNNATNGKREFEKHVQVVSLSESSVQYMSYPYSYNSGATWPASPQINYTGYHNANFITPSNFVQVVVCNESNSGYTDGLNGSTFDVASEITASYKTHVTYLKHAIGGAASAYNGGPINANNKRAGERVDGEKPSFTLVYVDPGINAWQGHDGPDVGFGFSTTASQRFWWEGVQDGDGIYGLDQIDTSTTSNVPSQGHNYSMNDFQDVTAWNGKDNLLELVFLYDESGNTSVPFWKGVLFDALTKNIYI